MNRKICWATIADWFYDLNLPLCRPAQCIAAVSLLVTVTAVITDSKKKHKYIMNNFTMAAHAAREANPLYPVPRLMNGLGPEIFYEKAAEWGEHQ